MIKQADSNDDKIPFAEKAEFVRDFILSDTIPNEGVMRYCSKYMYEELKRVLATNGETLGQTSYYEVEKFCLGKSSRKDGKPSYKQLSKVYRGVLALKKEGNNNNN